MAEAMARLGGGGFAGRAKSDRVRAGGGEVLVETIDPCEGEYGNHRQRHGKKTGGLQRQLGQCQMSGAPEGPGRGGAAGDLSAHGGGKDGLPAFHPPEKQAHPDRAEGGMFAGKSAAAHVGPEIEEGQDERERADGVSGVQRERRASQEVNGFLDQVKQTFARLAAGGFHWTELQKDFHKVPSCQAAGIRRRAWAMP